MRFLVSAVCFLSAVLLPCASGYQDRPDEDLTTVELIQKYGYPVEEHEITTEDGYMITMYRIPHGRNGTGVNRKPILVMHGLFGQCENYLVSGMLNASLAYYLADLDYDVWLGNARGNQHARKHKFLDPNSKQFWHFSYHEIGIYDLPAMIDYVLESTKKKKLYYIGHSQGGTSFYIMSSEKPEYQQKIILASLLAPAGFMGNFKNPLIMPIARMHRELTMLAPRANLFELPPAGISLSNFTSQICAIDYFKQLCLNFYHVILAGGDSGEFNYKMLPVLMKFLPSVSSRQPLHYAQSIMSGYFRKWDYGVKKNMRKYGSAEPADYRLKNITVPVAIYYSLNDNLVYPKDAEDTCRALPNCMRKFRLANPKWTHLDFIFSMNAIKMLYAPLERFMRKYDKP